MKKLELPIDEELLSRITEFQVLRGLTHDEALRAALISPCERFLLECESKKGMMKVRKEYNDR